jgi:predicted ATPase/class 3 adenylate cyclase
MGAQPIGTVTLLFSDIEGSTRLLHALGTDRFACVLERHRIILRDAFARHGGYEVDGDGDAFFVTFASAADAVAAASEGQFALAVEQWPEGVELRVRMGLHTGEPLVVASRYVGVDVHRAARIMAAGHGGQVLLSQSARDLLGSDPRLRDLGEPRLKDLLRPERLYQLQLDGLASEFPPLRGLNATNLPVASWPLVGRGLELAEIGDLLRDGAQLVTLTGAGGSGKTRLALQVAAESVDVFPDGVFFVGLAPLRSAELVPGEIADALGIGSTSEPLDLLHAHLAERQLLLVLDNAEHLPGLAAILARFSETRGLRLLVTSRAPLHLSWEREYRVDPLPEEDAIEFFVERARAVRRDFVSDTALPELCRRLDGLPLALELAAARVKLLSPQAILARLDAVLPFLSAGPQDLPERQQTLRATIEWSHDLLDETERAFFRRLSVFRGSCSLEAVEAVVDADLDLVGALVDHSLLKPVGDDRVFMLETLREFARERLDEAGETDVYTLRHARHYLERLEEIDPLLRGPRTSEFLTWYGAEEDNLRAMLDRLTDAAPTEAARAAELLSSYWIACGSLVEGRQHLERLVALDFPDGLQASLRQRLGDIESRLGDLDAAERTLGVAVALAEATGERLVLANALLDLGWIEHGRGHSEQALALGERALTEAEATGDRRAQVRMLSQLGAFLTRAGRDDEARDAHTRGIEGFHALGDRVNEAIETCNLACIDFYEGDYKTAYERFTRAQEMLSTVGYVDVAPLSGAAYSSLALGRDVEAAAMWQEALAIAAESGDVAEVATAIGGIGLAAAQLNPSAAARLRGAAADLRRTRGLRQDPRDEVFERRHEQPLIAALGVDDFAREKRAGAALTLDAAIEAARSLVADNPN